MQSFPSPAKRKTARIIADGTCHTVDARNISQELCAAQGLSVPPTVSPLAAPSTTATDSDLAASTTADADGTDHEGDDDDEDADDLGDVVDDTDASGVVFDGDSHGADEAEFVDSTDADVDGGADDFVVEAEIVDVDADADVNGDDHDANDTIAVPVEAADADAGNIQPAPADNATNFVEFIGAASSAYQIPAIVGGMTALIGLAAL